MRAQTSRWMTECAAGARESFDRITDLLARQLQAPLAFFATEEEETRTIVEGFGLGATSYPAGHGTFAAACLAGGGSLVVPDASAHPAFRALPLVATPPYLRFYAGIPVRTPDGGCAGVLAVVDTHPRSLTVPMGRLLEDTRAVAEEMLLLVTLSAQDRLTRVLGRGMFEEILPREWRRAGREQSELSAVMIDVDNFKVYNDRMGHGAGDRCLQRVAEVVQDQFRRPGDMTFRYGGEEFVVLLPDTSLPAAFRLAQGAVRAVASLGIPSPGGAHGHVTISAGVSSTRPDDRTGGPDGLIEAADRALYAAKDAGRNVALASAAVARLRSRNGLC